MKLFKASWVILCIGFATTFSHTATSSIPDWDSKIQHGKLENGLQYFAYHSDNADEPFNVRLIVHAGSIDEPEIKGIAHAVEHMVFNQSVNHPEGIHDYLSKIGWKAGKEVNAKTGQTETNYMIRTRPHDALDLKGSLQLLADIAGGAKMLEEQWEKEKKIIIEEKRQGEHVIKRLSKQIKQSTKANSKYAEGTVIGSYQSINEITQSDLKAFYESNYVASNMSLIISGYFKPENLVHNIEDTFEYLPTVPKPERNYVDFPLDQTIKLNKVQDREGTTSKVALGLRMALPPKSTSEGINLRLENYIIRKLLMPQIHRNAVFYPESVSSISGVLKEPSNERLVLAFSAKTEDHDDGVQAILKEIERLRRYGFSEESLQKVLSNTKATARRNATSTSKRSYASWEDKITNALLTDTVVADPNEKFEYTMKLLNGVTLERINARLVEILNAPDIFIYYQAPGDIKLSLPSVEEVEEWKRGIALESIEQPIKQSFSNEKPLMALPREEKEEVKLPIAPPQINKKIPSFQYHEKQSVFEWKLENGNRVVWLNRPTPSNKILLKAITNIGYENQEQPEWLSQSALQLFEQNHPVGVKPQDWLDWQKENNSKWKFKLHPQHLDLSIATTVDDLESTFYAFWLNHQKRDFDNNAIEALNESVAMALKSDKTLNLSELRYGEKQDKTAIEKRLKSITTSTLESVSNSLLNQTQTMFIVGEIDTKYLEKLIAQYLSPFVNTSAMTSKPVSQRVGSHSFIRELSGDLKTRTTIYGSKSLDWTPERAFILSTLNPVIQEALRKKLRLELAGTYRVIFEMKLNPNNNQVETELSFLSDPKRSSELTNEALAVLSHLTPYIQSMNIERVKEDIKFAESTRLEVSSTWLRRLMLSYREYNDPRYLDSMLTIPNELSINELVKLSESVFPIENQVLIESQYSPQY
ncbi:M16 family metallopeptidase [Psychromonas aquatilis]|uniref:Insulinase family protein n=1 Tax=Psychromonas aquatilis TaxID=2005072 RepID=A0ABU9GNH6_9GAMM